MKKVLAVALVATMVLSMTACGNAKANTTTETAKTETTKTEAAATDTTTDKAATEDTTKEATNGTLVMATNAEFPPYEYREGDEIVGIDAEIAAAVAEELGMKLQIEDMAFDSIIAAVTAGKADVGIAGMTVTEDRLASVNFSTPYTQAAQVIIVKAGSEIASPDDLSGKTIGVQLGTTGDIYAADIADATIDRYNKGFEAVQALLQGKVDAVIIDREPANVFVEQNEGLAIVDEEFTVEDYAIAIAKDNTDLLDKVNAALAKLEESGKLQEIKDKYITAE